MRKFLYVSIFFYASILLLVNLNIIPIESLLQPNENSNQKTRAINLLQKKFNAKIVRQDENFTESKIIKLINKSAVFDTNVIGIFKHQNTDYIMLSASFSDKSIRFILEYNSKMHWKKFKLPQGNVIAAIKIKKIKNEDQLKFLTGIDGLEMPVEKKNIIYCEGELLDFINI